MNPSRDLSELEMLAALPVRASATVELWATSCKELNTQFLIFSREPRDPQEGFIGWPDLDDRYRHRARWAAGCVCTACGEKFQTGWTPGGGCVFTQGPDDGLLTAFPDEGEDGEDFDSVKLECAEGELTDCPFCRAQLRAVRKSSVRRASASGSLALRTMAATVGRVRDMAALFFWLCTRTIDPDGDSRTGVFPVWAAFIREDGRLAQFSRVRRDMRGRVFPGRDWKRVIDGQDPFQAAYYSNGESRIGGHFLPPDPDIDLAGSTGEKTGLAEYSNSGGRWPWLYLKFWRKFRNIENLAKAGWINLIDSAIDEDIATYRMNGSPSVKMPVALQYLLNWNEARPFRMLGIERENVRPFSFWDCRFFSIYRDMRLYCSVSGAVEFEDHVEAFGSPALAAFARRMRHAPWFDSGIPFRKVRRYLEKHWTGNAGTGLEMLWDCWHMLDQVQEQEPTRDQLWPKDLAAAHDRLAAQLRIAGAKAADAGFLRILATWGRLEWSDGELCAVLPRCNSELVQEGRVLHHCVGSYGEEHINGKIIVFIRRARRPERSYYTLNIDTTQTIPAEIQLHGYRNEHVNGHTLRIPQKVRDFCDAWEKNILLPCAAEVRQQKQAKLQKMQKKEGKSA